MFGCRRQRDDCSGSRRPVVDDLAEAVEIHRLAQRADDVEAEFGCLMLRAASMTGSGPPLTSSTRPAYPRSARQPEDPDAVPLAEIEVDNDQITTSGVVEFAEINRVTSADPMPSSTRTTPPSATERGCDPPTIYVTSFRITGRFISGFTSRLALYSCIILNILPRSSVFI